METQLVQYCCLLDNNYYRLLTQTPSGKAIINFSNSLKNNELTKNIFFNGGVITMRTPFSLMEGLGIVVPDINLNLSKELLLSNNPVNQFEFIGMEARKLYSNLQITKKQYLIDKAMEQSNYTVKEAKPIEKMFLLDILAHSDVEQNFITFLTFDYLCKFNFPLQTQIFMIEYFLTPLFFLRNTLSSALSQFRIAKKYWDLTYHLLLSDSYYSKETLEKMNKAMRLKTKKDFLDCEIIHFITIGLYSKEVFHPVLSFTCDDSQTVINRIRYYKTMIETFKKSLKNLPPAKRDIENFNLTMNMWRQGIIVCCDNSGSFNKVIEVKNVEPFW